MANIFFYSDPHFGHEGVCRFLRADGVTKLRPFDNAGEMDEHLVEQFNRTVGVRDKVYFLGDIAISRKSIGIIHRLHGDKVLIRGNHDIFKLGDYTKYFRDIRGVHVMDGMIMTHIPVHPESISRFGTNIHGHLHEKRVRLPRGVDARTGEILYSDEIDPRYHCVCVEQTDYKPIAYEDVMARIQAEGGTIGFKNGNGKREAM
jgi:calcineurin-like phosphoesterase family protein